MYVPQANKCPRTVVAAGGWSTDSLTKERLTVPKTTRTRPDTEDPGPTVDQRRQLLLLLAEGGPAEMRATIGDDWRDYVMQAIACELVAVSRQLEEEYAPALKTVGAIVAGLLGSPVVNDPDDDFLEQMNAAGKRCRAKFLGRTEVLA